MADVPTVANYLFKASAVLNAVSVPGHIVYGWKHLEPVLHKWNTNAPEHRVADASARVGWDHMTVGIIAADGHGWPFTDETYDAAVLNWRWSLTRGPQATDDKVLFWSLFAGGLYVGKRFWQLREFRPLLCLWVAPAFSLLGWALVR